MRMDKIGLEATDRGSHGVAESQQKTGKCECRDGREERALV
jgi:hypothetical protein